MKRLICFFTTITIIFSTVTAFGEGENKADTGLGIDARSAILMEEASGEVLYESEADTQVPIASVTKIMTMLLIMEAVDRGDITLDDMVTVSDNAMSYGGSTMFLETGEKLTVSDMLKGIAVASANDGCVAMAEYLCGSESAFVDEMNKRARELGMKNTHFVNTNGLDDDNHFSSARDVAIMSKELIGHKKIFDYTSIWTDSLRGGKFRLANTNKLIRFYDGANGLKTGSTSKALCCLSATAKRDDMQLIAVILGALTSKKRFEGARALLDYGFANYQTITYVTAGEDMGKAAVEKGEENEVGVMAGEGYSALGKKGDSDNAEREIVLDEKITAPLSAGDRVGTLKINRNGETIAEIPLTAKNDVRKKGISTILRGFFSAVFGMKTQTAGNMV